MFLVRPETSDAALEQLTSQAEEVLRRLELPFRQATVAVPLQRIRGPQAVQLTPAQLVAVMGRAEPEGLHVHEAHLTPPFPCLESRFAAGKAAADNGQSWLFCHVAVLCKEIN